MTTLSQAIAICRSNGCVVLPPKDKDEALRNVWNNVTRSLSEARDLVRDGARLKVRHAAFLDTRADVADLLRDGIIDEINTILESAVVVCEAEDMKELA